MMIDGKGRHVQPPGGQTFWHQLSTHVLHQADMCGPLIVCYQLTLRKGYDSWLGAQKWDQLNIWQEG